MQISTGCTGRVQLAVGAPTDRVQVSVGCATGRHPDTIINHRIFGGAGGDQPLDWAIVFGPGRRRCLEGAVEVGVLGRCAHRGDEGTPGTRDAAPLWDWTERTAEASTSR